MMDTSFSAEKIVSEKGRTDFVFMGLVILLVGLGLAALFSSSFYYGEYRFGDPLHFIKRQLLFVAVGLAFAFFASRISLELVRKLIPVLVVVSFLLTALTFLPAFGKTTMGARRWIYVENFSFQPSELVKLTVIIYLAHIFSKKADRVNDFFQFVLPPLIICSLFILLVYLQNDFSTAFFIFFLVLIMFYVAKTRIIYFVLLATVGIPLSLILLFTKEHRVQRIIAFLDPLKDPGGASFQVNAARNALMNGGMWGKGLGEGVKKLGGLPEAHSDFIFAVLGEEMGFIGILFILAVFAAFAFRGYSAAVKSEDCFGYYLAFGLTTSILYQALLNIAVVAGLVPATGVPLPFFSSGGTSILITLIMCGLILNVSKNGAVHE
jgi:cell division protein FtsW